MMDMEKKKNNIVKISGEVRSPFEYSHETHGENFYTFIVASQRTSGTYDSVPVTVSERLIDAAHDATGERIVVEGQFRSHNTHSETGNHLKLYVFATSVEFEEKQKDDENNIFLDGYICRKPIYRRTPLGREVADMLFAVNRQYEKSDYIPCICWGRNAYFSTKLEVGEHLQAWGSDS